jgi:pilus assembly protein CpaB
MQRGRGFLFLLLALACGVGAALSARAYVASRDAAARSQQMQIAEILVADADLPLGAALRPEQLRRASWPAAHVPQGALRDESQALDRALRRPLAAGEPVVESALHPAGVGSGLAAALDGNRRAVSVKVDKIVGVAGFIKPGSRVDVIATLRRVDQNKQVPFSQVILQDVPVLAIDQKMEEADNGVPEVVSVVTLAVAPVEAEKLTYGAHEGRLQLALRRPGDDRVFQTKSIRVGDLASDEEPRREARRGPTVQVIRGGEVSHVPYSPN